MAKPSAILGSPQVKEVDGRDNPGQDERGARMSGPVNTNR